MKLEQLKNKKIAIWGFGVEAQAAAKYLTLKAIEFEILAQSAEVVQDYNFNTSRVDLNLLNQYDVIIKSPGISPYQDFLKDSTAAFTSSTALWFNNEKRTPVIAISGTKGKSTTSSLLAHVIKEAGLKVSLVGNIGEPLLLTNQDVDFIVLECSSYQIYDGAIKAELALLSNLFPEHLDWHKNKENYFADKIKLIKDAKIKLINFKNHELVKQAKDLAPRFYNHESSFWVNKQALYFQDERLLNINDTQLLGEHNLENMAAVLSICNYIGLDLQGAIAAILHFEPLPHRLQNLGRVGGNVAINDSISSTPIATIAALKTLNVSKTTVLIGGFDRGIDWTDFFEYIDDNPPFAILLSGQNADDIFLQFNKFNFNCRQKLIKLKNLKQAIKKAQEISDNSVTLLLSPGSPSFDEFNNYIERGKFFENTLNN